MERDLLLFILIIIVTVVLNIINAVKKRGAKPPVQAETAEDEKGGETDMQDILRELLGGEKSGKVVAETKSESDEKRAYQIEPASTSNYQFDEPEYTRPSKSMSKHEVQQTTDPEDITLPTNFYEQDDYDSYVKPGFDLRAGVIKQAILNRPYN